MARKAISTREFPAKAAAIREAAKKEFTRGMLNSTKEKFKTKNFESLDTAEKEELLKAVAVALGFLQPS